MMTSHPPASECPVCRGRRRITLPLHRPIEVQAAALTLSCEPSSKDFDCPECTAVAPEHRVGFIETAAPYSKEIEDPAYMDYVRRTAARAMAERLLQDGYITFDNWQMGDGHRMEMRATLGAVHPNVVRSMEDRIAVRQFEVADMVANEAGAQIDDWGSHFGHVDILKRDAKRLIGTARRMVFDRLARRH